MEESSLPEAKSTMEITSAANEGNPWGCVVIVGMILMFMAWVAYLLFR